MSDQRRNSNIRNTEGRALRSQNIRTRNTVNAGFDRNRRNNFIVQGSLLAVASIVVRIIGMVYRVPLTAIIGDEGNGYYTSAYSIYTLLLILSSFSMPTAVSKIVSANMVKGNYRNTHRVLKTACFYATIVGFLMFCMLWFGSDFIAEVFLKKPFCKYALRALAPTVWIMAYLGILRGYFQGSGNMVPTAISQILEQILNAIISILAASILFKKGAVANVIYQSDKYSTAFGAAGGAIGTGAGALTALAFFLILYSSQMHEMHRNIREDRSRVDSYGTIGLLLAGTMLPILISSTVYNISSVIDDSIFGNIMTYLGKAENIVTQWGVFGEYHILFNIPVALSNALSSSLIPSLTRAVAEHNRRDTVSRVRYSIRFTMLIAIPATVGLCALADPICRMLFPGKNVGLLIMLTRIGSVAVVFYSLSTISNAILQGLGHLSIPLKHALISLVIHIACLIALLLTGMGIYAVVISNIIFAFMMCLLNQLAIKKHVRLSYGVTETYILPFIAAAVMGIVAFACSMGIRMVLPEAQRYGRIGSVIEVAPSVVIAIVVYFGLLIKLHAFTAEDLDNMPMGGRLKRFVH
ncbi:stage V sporulation protein B [Oribacterium sp. KHPX15]|uniref:putative polysaccharide biosynthesis protein n=1 Tax=Oribacterium sp. KHPX15 TaxID=1855342 RepID=UPI00089502F1|nr:polysaccharide biosynthesis protein [Oribacterium sp. KHPX15]SDZ90959.1 stage V sporulation protein B [Oribacterium sp. KHPX15]